MADSYGIEATGTKCYSHGVFRPFKEGYDGTSVVAADPFQAICGFYMRVATLDHDASARCEQGRKTFQNAPDLPRRDSIRWVYEYQIVFSSPLDEPPEHLRNIPQQHLPLVRVSRALKILPHSAYCLDVLLDERRPLASAAHSFDAKSPGSGVEVQDLASIEELT